MEKNEYLAFILPRNFLAVLIIFAGRGGEPPDSLTMSCLEQLKKVEFASKIIECTKIAPR